MTVSNRLNIPSAVVGIVDRNQQVIGTGFFADKEWLITCAHLIEIILGSLPSSNQIVYARTQQSEDNASITIAHSDGRTTKGYVHYIDKPNDIAVLSSFPPAPDIFDLAKNNISRPGGFESYVFPSPKISVGLIVRGEILGEVSDQTGRRLLQLRTSDIRDGASGAPVIDLKTKQVLGMISSYLSQSPNERATLFAIPSEFIQKIIFELNQPSNNLDKRTARDGREAKESNRKNLNNTPEELSQEHKLLDAIELNPKDIKPYLDLSSLLEKQGDLQRAEEVLRKAVAANPKESLAYRGLGRLLEMLAKYSEAISVYKQSMALNPKDARSYQSMGIVMGKINDFDEAEKNFQQAIELRPNDAGLYRDLGSLYENQNRFEDARLAYSKANALRPDSDWTNRRLEELSKKQKTDGNKQTTSDTSNVNINDKIPSEPVMSEVPITDGASSAQTAESGDNNELPVPSTIDTSTAEPESPTPEPTPTPEPSTIFKPYTIIEDALEKHAATDKPIQNIKQDKLDFAIYVNALHNFILSKYTTTPITISIDGPWGTGKSSLMFMLKGKLDPQRDGVRKLYEWFVGLLPWWKWFFGFIRSSVKKSFVKILIAFAVRNDVDEEGVYLYFGHQYPRFVKYISDIMKGFSTDPEILNQPSSEKMEERVRKWAMVYADCEPMQPRYHYAVWLNAWKFDNQEEVWASLALATMEQIKQKHGLLWRLWFWLDLTFSRFSFWSALWHVVKQFLVPLVFAIVMAYYDIIIGSFEKPLEAFAQYGSPLLWAGFLISGILTVASIFKDPFQISLEKVFDRPNYKDKVSFLAHFEKDFAKIVRSATKNGLGWKPSKLVIFIDDLDRCEPPKSADIVEAVNLFLDAEGCVFVIGMDSESVSKSVEVKYKDLFERMRAENTGVVSLGRSFLDKIVQIPFSVPRATSQQIMHMVEDSLGQQLLAVAALPSPALQEDETSQPQPVVPQPPVVPLPSSVEPILPVSRIDPASYAKPEVRAAILKGAELLADNPRQVKTFINLFRLSIYIANERKILEEKVVADQTSGLNLEKLAMWTACSVRWPSLVKHFHEDTQITPLRIFMYSVSQKIQPTFIWSEPSITPNEVKKIYRELRDYEKGSDSHWCYLPWEWWLLEPDFLKAIKSLQDLWSPTEVGETDWLRVLLTMTRPIV